MLFNSMQFALFMPVVFMIYWMIPNKYKYIFLLMASYYFYMSWNVKYVFLILLTSVISYLAAILLEKRNIKKQIVLACTLVSCLGVLFVFKYFNFISNSIADVLGAFSISVNPITLKLLLPVGISFYTFQTLSYVIDVYRGEIAAEHNFFSYAAYVSFFPQLVAGPIERSSNLLPQIKSEKVFNCAEAGYGVKLMLWGFFKKLAIADVIAVYVDAAYSDLNNCTGFELVLAVFLFTIQIYCDFSGYSDIALGTAKLLGINLMKNFDSPYFSRSVKEFWGRWHISLSTWFRDYVYIPLGGNRCSKIKNEINLLTTFLLSGLWHGANWTYVIWGGIHGIAQCIEKSLKLDKKTSGKMVSAVRCIIVFAFCNITWIFFRAQSIGDALYVITNLTRDITNVKGWFDHPLGMENIEILLVMMTIMLLGLFDYLSLKMDVIKKVASMKAVFRYTIYLILVWLILVRMPSGGNSEFLYFQF